MQQLLLLAVLALGHHPTQPLEVLAAVPAAELVDLVLPVQDLWLPSEEAVAGMAGQVDPAFRAGALEFGPAAGAAELVHHLLILVVIAGLRQVKNIPK